MKPIRERAEKMSLPHRPDFRPAFGDDTSYYNAFRQAS